MKTDMVLKENKVSSLDFLLFCDNKNINFPQHGHVAAPPYLMAFIQQLKHVFHVNERLLNHSKNKTKLKQI